MKGSKKLSEMARKSNRLIAHQTFYGSDQRGVYLFLVLDARRRWYILAYFKRLELCIKPAP